ncbi:enoyl-CoA hydratase-related protein [Mucilaginibacter polytrichastri]|uniref:3-hydroxybutyryl-CoA dehydratase n=1 Tax=Mucilaginibacter polytrichastri TaxID=1302689 RepID=A0A1Q6A4W9_9SPHI|nr:enoyl-CoA hydratase-related protein [Mucilaginibacter polytrichastri]OKS89046.1 3-hydroxybutyryl-CoA dehydratase [Mucilaginibacter polytrichastri]SFS95781.1 enoyl-CoA hydratase [Mucilaginibacter polytrichastri]
MEFQNLLIEDKNRIRYITINRESKLNALNRDTIAELHTAFANAFSNKAIGGIIITGAGQKAFVAGADIAEFADLDTESASRLAKENQAKVFDLVANGSKPVIAAINGYALGGGLELALAAHIRIASTTAKMGLPEVTLGLIPGYGGTQRLSKLVGSGKAFEMILTADMITADEAYLVGLVNYVVEPGEIIARAEALLNKMLQRAPLALAAAIAAINAAGAPDGFDIEIAEFGKCFGNKDTKEGITAFLEKRKPDFRGE